jgi:hypothetical protein
VIRPVQFTVALVTLTSVADVEFAVVLLLIAELVELLEVVVPLCNVEFDVELVEFIAVADTTVELGHLTVA